MDRLQMDKMQYVALRPERQAVQAERREAEYGVMERLLMQTVPCCCGSAASRLETDDCSMELSGSTARVVYYGIGGTGREFAVPEYRCSTHGVGGVIVEPFQVGCIPTSPVVNTIYLSEDLVVQSSRLQLLNG